MSRFRSLPIATLVVLAGLGWLFWPQLKPLVAMVPGLSSLAEHQGDAARPAAAPRGVPVVTDKVERKDVPRTLDAVGTVQSIASILIRPRTDSEITAIHVEEGAKVKAGELLFTLDDRVLQAQLAQVEAQAHKDEAQLEQAKRDLDRAEDLLRRKISTQVQRDIAATLVRVNEAQLASDRAQRDSLLASLSYTKIVAPVSGRIGSITAKVGAVVRAADSGVIATINQFDPIYVAFSIPQSALVPLRQAMAERPVSAEVSTPRKPVRGTVTFVENAVDPATGTVLVKATMPNSDELLWPGAFASVQVILGEQAGATVVPSAAVQIGQDGAFVFVVKDGKAELKRVAVERTQGDVTVLASGVEPGEDVVIDGQLRLVNGAPINRNPARATTAAPALANGS
ncbi:efflux RND transporter periplasmic adaptor subunit [Blastochloris viridis]|uniref:Efflux pump periplasmic linker BepD n=1 Tax=Blastochloris viridis TaxID=1079 RepID=A0A0H5BG80_BLAVI|nr:efflux RND transporter periplasmic adaptor subunit [Blastochloris viridis]ALK09960.1 Multidrug resistance protein MdtA precursor [Blastochloris viridis]BAS00130.1 probable Co/Zn/Cd efflux system membrane fusion protein [Blastochloris viridis]CUU42623.1 Efflux pump periplasmic linker BepD precursor [Blastochloris viridis]